MKALLALLFFTGCVSVQPSKQAPSHFKKIVYIVFENEDFVPVLKQPDFARFAALGVSFNQMHAETHPSQPNYIAMVAGSTLGVTSNMMVDLKETHIGDLLEAKGLDWKAYGEGYPGNCFLSEWSNDYYARKHMPFVSFLNVTKNPARCAKIVSANNFMDDYRNNSLPAFSIYVPDMNNCGHDTNVDFAGKWLTRTFGPILNNPDALGDILFVLTFDESNPQNEPNQIYTVLIGRNVIRGGVNNQKMDHYALLKMVEDEFGLGNLGRMDASAPVIENIWK